MACDDGDTSPNDGCDANCVVENGWSCTGGDATTPQNDVCTEVCGDGVDTNVTEACEDGGTAPDDGCSPTCTVETGWYCLPDDADPTTTDDCYETCGDGLNF